MNSCHKILGVVLSVVASVVRFSIVIFACSSALADDLTATPVSLPPGETLLTDIGIYRVFWQSYGRPPVAMPGAWMGHFDPHSGISYQPWGRVLGRQSLLMHSPWHVPPGKAWVDYPLALPKTSPIRLVFGIAMGPDVAVPGKSDGVTFSCYLTVDGQQRELMRRHHDKAEWIDYAFDLSPYGGKTVILRLQVEPGPRNDPSFDFSFFGDAKLTVGNTAEPRGQIVSEIVSTKAYQIDNGYPRLSNVTTQGVTPSNILRGKNWLEGKGDSWRFTYDGYDCRIVYTYTPESGTLDDFRVAIDNSRPFQPAVGGGATFIIASGGKIKEVPLHGGKAVRVVREGDTLKVVWEYNVEDRPLRIDWSYRIQGKALVVSARCDEGAVSRFSLGELGAVPLRKTIEVPYLAGHVHYLRTPGVFVCRYLDWTVSHASKCPQGVADYEPKTDGLRNPLVETGYVAVSPDLGEVLPNIPHPPSPYRKLLGARIMLDIWGHHQGTYQGDAANLRALKDNGVDHLAIISHDWQRYGYDVKLPDHLPANPQYGGDAGMIAFGRAANECGYVWSLHENYIDLYPDAPSYDPSARVLQSDGTPSKAWFNPGTKVQSFGLKCNRALDFARRNAPKIHRRYGTTAAYLDVHTCVPPWHQLDHQADQPMAAMASGKVLFDSELFRYMRQVHGGPLFGEGANHFYWAGCCDGVEAQVAGGEDHVPLVDFDLLKLHPQMVNHGMGYYERWYRRGYAMRWGHDAGSMEQIDKYRAQELAYGHAGFVGNLQTDDIISVAREHHLMHPVQRLYGAARPVEIRYEVEGQWVTASAALVAGETSRQRIRYDTGLTLWVNWRAEPWQIEGCLLPQWGFRAVGPETRVVTALYDGHVADYAECPEYVFADARTNLHVTGLQARKETKPRLASLKSGDEADFSAHLNRPGTWIDFGPVATDGAVKINRAKDRLVLFPYPRDTPFRVSLDLKTLAPAADTARVKVRALAAGNGRDLGLATFQWDKSRLVITTGLAGAGRYVVQW